MNFCSTLIAVQVLVALICHSKLFFSGWYWVIKQGQLKAYTVDTNSTPSLVKLVEINFQKELMPGVFLQVQRVIDHLWWNHKSPCPVVTSWYSLAFKDFKRTLLLFFTIKGSVSPFCPNTSVSTVILSFLPLNKYKTASYPRQVAQIGNGFPFSFCLLAQSKTYWMLDVHWLSASMGISPPGKKTPLILLRILSSCAWEQWQQRGSTCAPAIYKFLMQLALMQV